MLKQLSRAYRRPEVPGRMCLALTEKPTHFDHISTQFATVQSGTTPMTLNSVFRL